MLLTLEAELHKHYSLLVTSGEPVTAAVKNSFAGITKHSRTLCEVIGFHNRRFAEKVKVGKKSGRMLKRFEITKRKGDSLPESPISCFR